VGERVKRRYEVQFWGGVNLQRPPRDDYARLRGEGFPIVYKNLPQLLAAGVLVATPSQYTITYSDAGGDS
jgi:hypothetical protein